MNNDQNGMLTAEFPFLWRSKGVVHLRGGEGAGCCGDEEVEGGGNQGKKGKAVCGGEAFRALESSIVAAIEDRWKEERAEKKAAVKINANLPPSWHHRFCSRLPALST